MDFRRNILITKDKENDMRILLAAVLISTAIPASAFSLCEGREGSIGCPSSRDNVRSTIIVPSDGTTLRNGQGAINLRNGQHYPNVGGGVINLRDGQFYPEVAGGYINPRTGEFMPST